MVLNYSTWKLNESGFNPGYDICYYNRLYAVVRINDLKTYKNIAENYFTSWTNLDFLTTESKWNEYRSQITPYIIFDFTILNEIKTNKHIGEYLLMEYRSPYLPEGLVRIEVTKPGYARVFNSKNISLGNWPALKNYGKWLKK